MEIGMEQQAYRMADKLVPISFIGAGLTYLLTRNVMKALLSFVMVDFSCALKLSIPLQYFPLCKKHLNAVSLLRW